MKRICCAILFTVVFVASAAPQQKFPNTCASGKPPHFPSQTATAIDRQCGLQGTPPQGQPEDGLQNQSKNNFCADTSTAKAIKLDKIASLEGDAEKDPQYRAGQAPTNRAFLKALGEGNAVIFEGYVFQARQECKETVNCGTAVPNENASHDIHIALLEEPRKTKPDDPKQDQDKEECTGFVAEMIPHHRPAQWTACNVNDVAAQGLRVRVTGQQFFDGSHVPCKDGAPQGTNPKRVSLWEIHPIYAFEVCPKEKGDCSNGGWQPLEQFAGGNTTCPQEKNCQKKNNSKGNHKTSTTGNTRAK